MKAQSTAEFWSAALDRLKAVRGFETDVDLASSLGLSKQVLFQIRKGLKGPPDYVVFSIVDETECPISRELLFALLPSKLAEGLSARERNISCGIDWTASIDQPIPA